MYVKNTKSPIFGNPTSGMAESSIVEPSKTNKRLKGYTKANIIGLTGEKSTSTSNTDKKYMLGNDDDYRTTTINIHLPKHISKKLKHNSRDVMLYHMIIDVQFSKNTLLINKKKVFWENDMPPSVAMLEPTKEHELLTHKIIRNSVEND